MCGQAAVRGTGGPACQSPLAAALLPQLYCRHVWPPSHHHVTKGRPRSPPCCRLVGPAVVGSTHHLATRPAGLLESSGVPAVRCLRRTAVVVVVSLPAAASEARQERRRKRARRVPVEASQKTYPGFALQALATTTIGGCHHPHAPPVVVGRSPGAPASARFAHHHTPWGAWLGLEGATLKRGGLLSERDESESEDSGKRGSWFSASAKSSQARPRTPPTYLAQRCAGGGAWEEGRGAELQGWPTAGRCPAPQPTVVGPLLGARPKGTRALEGGRHRRKCSHSLAKHTRSAKVVVRAHRRRAKLPPGWRTR